MGIPGSVSSMSNDFSGGRLNSEGPVLGIIPARGGSKSVPRKNLYPLAGRPLIAYSIITAREAHSLDRLIVSTDDPEIAGVAREYGAEVPFIRPAELGQDDTPDLPVFQHALSWLGENQQYGPAIIVHPRPTQPLREAGDIDRVVTLLRETGADSVKSVRPAKEHPHKMWRNEDRRLLPYVDTEFRRRVGPDYPRQKLEAVYISTGVVDAVWSRVVIEGSTTGDHVIPYPTDPMKSVDLDTAEDFVFAEFLIGKHNLIAQGQQHG